MPRLAIVAALHDELRALLASMPDEQPVRRAGRDFWVGHLDGHDVVVVLSRIGKVAAATTAAVLCEAFELSGAVFTGTAGGLHPDARVGDMVVADALLQHDLDASPIFPRHEVPLYGTDRFHADPALSAAVEAAARAALADPANGATALLAGQGIAHPSGPRVLRGLVVSGDRFVATTAENAALTARLPAALAVEMEGAAFAQVCHDFGVPFAVLRTVSDRADDQAHVDFPRFVAEVASPYSVAVVRRLLPRLAGARDGPIAGV